MKNAGSSYDFIGGIALKIQMFDRPAKSQV